MQPPEYLDAKERASPRTFAKDAGDHRSTFSEVQHEKRGSNRIRYLLTALMVLLAALGLAVADLHHGSGSKWHGGAWLIFLASIFVLRPRGWKIPLYLVVGYIGVAMLSFILYPVAGTINNPQAISRECRGWDSYLSAFEPLMRSANARNSRLMDSAMTRDAVRGAIDSTEANIEKLEALSPPRAMAEMHKRSIGLEQSYIQFYGGLLDGTASDEMLLRMHDDWVIIGHLGEEANKRCAR